MIAKNNSIGILTALPSEARCLTAQRLHIGQTMSLNTGVLLHIAGMGAEHAKAGALNLAAHGARVLISWGLAGGLAPNLAPGHLIIPERILDQQSNVFLADLQWKNQLAQTLGQQLTMSSGPLLQSDQVVASIDEKKELFIQHQAEAVDMESAAIAEIAQKAELPFVAIRAIVDSATMALPVWLTQSFNTQNQIQSAKLAGKLCMHPGAWLSLLHLYRSFSKAKKTLTTAAKRLSLAERKLFSHRLFG